MARRIVFLLFLTFLSNTLSAQRLLGVSAGTSDIALGMYLNPANLGGCNDRYIMPLLSFNVEVDNNLGTIGSLSQIIRSSKKNGANPQGIFTYGGNIKFSMLAPMAEVRGPGIILPLSRQHTLAFTTRVRVLNEFYNFDKLIYKVAIKPSAQLSVNADLKNFKWTLHSWSELGLAYGGILADNDHFQLKVGFKVNLLGGVGYICLDGKSMSIDYKQGIDSFNVSKADLLFSSSLYGADNAINGTQILGNIFGGGGRGFGGDVGITYIAKNTVPKTTDFFDHSGDDYRFALSLSVTDVGSITYYETYQTTITGGGYLNSQNLSASIKNFNNLTAYLQTRGFVKRDSVNATVVYLPTALVGSVDVHINHHLFTNLMIIKNIADDAQFGNQYFTQFTVTPRYQSKNVMLGLPVTYNTLAQNLRFGFGLHYRSLYIGSDDVLLFVLNHQYGANFYAGCTVKIPNRPHRFQ